MKKNALGLPLLNNFLSIEDFDPKKITYIEMGTKELLEVYADNISVYFSGIVVEKKKKIRGTYLYLAELRGQFPVMGLYFKLSHEINHVITGKEILGIPDVELMFPLDEDDEDEAKEFISEIAKNLDLTKLHKLD